ncbi:MAG: nucleoside deaminase [Xanthomonadales bacterium]|nr:nucleoside deaminase [Xanthomonadales bacterium]
MDIDPHELAHVRAAIELARTARGRGNRPFGAVLVSADGTVLDRAGNTQSEDGQVLAHAELNLLLRAANEHDEPTLAAATLFTSAEPCAMCAGALFWSGVGRLVFALSTPRLHEICPPSPRTLRVTARDVLTAGGRPVEVIGPVLESEAETVFDE